jgi:RNA polymerase sigma factor (sigma-70 family)
MSSLSDEKDETLVARCRAGDGAAWEALVRRYQRLVYAIVRRAGLDEQTAADVFQTVFMRLLQQLPRIDEPARLQAWIVTTAKRESILQRRRGARLVTMGDGAADAAQETIADEAPGPQQTLEHWQQLMRVRSALDRLDGRCRHLLQVLFAGETSGYDDVARQLNMPVGSIGPTRARCLAKLRRDIESAP